MAYRAAHALVIGGSIAGLMAARVLSDHCERVTVIERDHYPDQPEARPGVPQSNQIHIFQISGQRLLERYFPGARNDLIALGGIYMDMMGEAATFGAAGWLRMEPSRIVGVVHSRWLLEWYIHDQLTKNPRITFREGTVVDALVSSPDRRMVTGVRVHPSGQLPDDQNITEITADLVIDASGRDSKAPQWLDELGYGRPDEEVVNAHIGYVTRLYAQPEDGQRPWKFLAVLPKNQNNYRSGLITPLEGKRWLVLLSGAARDYPPTDDAGFLEFAKSLDDPAVYEAIKDAQPLGPARGYRRTENHRRHFEQMAAFPDGFAVTGDAVCSFNPSYGQGMSVAAMSAAALDACLKREGLKAGMTLRFQKAQAKVDNLPWQFAVNADLQIPGVEGKQSTKMPRFLQAYIDSVQYLYPANFVIREAFVEVANMIAPPTILFKPAIALRVCWFMLSGQRRKVLREREAKKVQALAVS